MLEGVRVSMRVCVQPYVLGCVEGCERQSIRTCKLAYVQAGVRSTNRAYAFEFVCKSVTEKMQPCVQPCLQRACVEV
jgi:hypothetical protein